MIQKNISNFAPCIIQNTTQKNIPLKMFFEINEILRNNSKNRDFVQAEKLTHKSKRGIIKRDFNLIAEYDRWEYDSRISQIKIVKSDNWLINKYDSTENN